MTANTAQPALADTAAVLVRLRADIANLEAERDAAWKAIDRLPANTPAEPELWAIYSSATHALGALTGALEWYAAQLPPCGEQGEGGGA